MTTSITNGNTIPAKRAHTIVILLSRNDFFLPSIKSMIIQAKEATAVVEQSNENDNTINIKLKVIGPKKIVIIGPNFFPMMTFI